MLLCVNANFDLNSNIDPYFVLAVIYKASLKRVSFHAFLQFCNIYKNNLIKRCLEKNPC